MKLVEKGDYDVYFVITIAEKDRWTDRYTQSKSFTVHPGKDEKLEDLVALVRKALKKESRDKKKKGDE